MPNKVHHIMTTTPFSSRTNTYKLSLWQWTNQDTTGLSRTEKEVIDRKIAGYLHNVINCKDY